MYMSMYVYCSTCDECHSVVTCMGNDLTSAMANSCSNLHLKTPKCANDATLSADQRVACFIHSCQMCVETPLAPTLHVEESGLRRVQALTTTVTQIDPASMPSVRDCYTKTLGAQDKGDQCMKMCEPLPKPQAASTTTTTKAARRALGEHEHPLSVYNLSLIHI